MSTAIARTNGAAPAPASFPAPQPQLPLELAPILTLLEKLTTLVSQPAPPPQKQELPVWVTLEQASEYLGLTVAYLDRLRREGKLKWLKDRHVKVRKADLDKLEL